VALPRRVGTMLWCLGSRCCITTRARLILSGRWLSSASTNCSPPAEASMPTVKKVLFIARLCTSGDDVFTRAPSPFGMPFPLVFVWLCHLLGLPYLFCFGFALPSAFCLLGSVCSSRGFVRLFLVGMISLPKGRQVLALLEQSFQCPSPV